jgi:transposase
LPDVEKVACRDGWLLIQYFAATRGLTRHVPSDHLVRKIDSFVDLAEVRAHLEPYCSEVGRPSIDPELMIRMLIVGYCFGVR